MFQDAVVVDRYLQFGWTSSPSAWDVCASAVEHAHTRTTIRDAVITPEGRASTGHVRVVPPRENEAPGKLPTSCVYLQDVGGGVLDPLWVSTSVDDGSFVEMERTFCGVCERPSCSRPIVMVCSVLATMEKLLYLQQRRSRRETRVGRCLGGLLTS